MKTEELQLRKLLAEAIRQEWDEFCELPEDGAHRWCNSWPEHGFDVEWWAEDFAEALVKKMNTLT